MSTGGHAHTATGEQVHMTNRFQVGLEKIRETGGKAPAVAAPKEAPETVSAAPPGQAPSRKGKVVISGYFDPAVRQQLAILAIKQNRSQAALMADALNMLFEKHSEPPIARA
jgi:hypothetical protein